MSSKNKVVCVCLYLEIEPTVGIKCESENVLKE